MNQGADSATNLKNRAAAVKLIILDCDGVLTDGRITLLPDGDETKSFDVKDGHGIVLALRHGIKVAIISGRQSSAVRARARELGIARLYEKAWNKTGPYEELLQIENVAEQDVCYVGDDVVDIPLMKRSGFAVAVADALDEVKQYAHFVTSADGGRGAVREVIDLIFKAQDKWDQVMERYRN